MASNPYPMQWSSGASFVVLGCCGARGRFWPMVGSGHFSTVCRVQANGSLPIEKSFRKCWCLQLPGGPSDALGLAPKGFTSYQPRC